jgi:hypothetical protein
MASGRSKTGEALFLFALLGLAEFLIFFRNPGHFFNGDSLFWLQNRYRSFAEFLAGFGRVDPALWYRPLSQRTVESLLFPVAGLNPVPYRIVGFVLFFSTTLAVFLLAKYTTQSKRIAWFSVLLFMPHLTHAYVTYDVAFTPELLLTLFYIGAASAYIWYLRSRNRFALALSVLLFAGSLMSKESAVGLPFTLLALWLFLPRKSRGTPLSLAPHFLILIVYVAFVFGYLHVRDINIGHLLGWNPRERYEEYPYGFNETVLDNIDVAFSWAFGVPRRVLGQWAFAAPWMRTFLKVLRLLACLGAIAVLFTTRRNTLAFGIAWFITAGAAAFLLTAHFVPYYLFLPLVGLALAGGTILDWCYTQCAKIAEPVGIVICAVVLGSWTWIHADAANRLAAVNPLMGGSADNSGNAFQDLKSLYPTLPKGVEIVIFNEEVPSLPGDDLGGVPLRLGYDDPTLVTYYSTDGSSIALEKVRSSKLLAFKFSDGHLTDITPIVHQRPDLLLPHGKGVNYHLELPETTAPPGESRTIRIPELQDEIVEILYAIEGKVAEPIKVRTDSRGEAQFPITSARMYTFIAVRREGETGWVTVSGSIQAR